MSFPKINKPRMTTAQIFNMSFGFLGIQFGFALQNGNASRILQTFGADVEHLNWFWLVAPLTGMVVQPLIGYYSDKTWTSIGRRRPFFLAGAILASLALIFMPNAGSLANIVAPLYLGAGILMLMDTSFNIAMEPFRALVGDNLPDEQRTLGFSMQTFLIGIGAVVGSWLPFFLNKWFGLGENTPTGQIPSNISIAFYIGAFIFLISILWTVVTTKEFPPEEYKKLQQDDIDTHGHTGIGQILKDFRNMPKTMTQLGFVQFFSWFALFSMWVYTSPAVATHVYGLAQNDTENPLFREAGDWVGIIFGVYNGVSAIYALFLPKIAAKFGRKNTHAFSLVCGGIGLISMYFVHNPNMLLLSMVGVGIAWASILAVPYAILAGSLPPHKMGLFVGMFNLFITLPQILNGIFGGMIYKHLFNSHAIYSIVLAGVSMLIAAFAVRFVDDSLDKPLSNTL
jgi:maltose/moltooligosaccharide transporter